MLSPVNSNRGNLSQGTPSPIDTALGGHNPRPTLSPARGNFQCATPTIDESGRGGQSPRGTPSPARASFLRGGTPSPIESARGAGHNLRGGTPSPNVTYAPRDSLSPFKILASSRQHLTSSPYPSSAPARDRLIVPHILCLNSLLLFRFMYLDNGRSFCHEL